MLRDRTLCVVIVIFGWTPSLGAQVAADDVLSISKRIDDLIVKMVGDEYLKAKPDTVLKSAHVGMAASNTYLFMTKVLPRAIKTYGGVDADSLRKAALDLDVPDGGTLLGFGAKFEPPEAEMAGQNLRGYPVVVQYIDDKSYVVWPKAVQQREPVLNLPDSSPYAAK